MRRVSKKRAKENREYLKLRNEFLDQNRFCFRCSQKASDIHHKMGRGKYLCAVEFFMAVCRSCHDYIESNKKWARALGYILYK